MHEAKQDQQRDSLGKIQEANHLARQLHLPVTFTPVHYEPDILKVRQLTLK